MTDDGDDAHETDFEIDLEISVDLLNKLLVLPVKQLLTLKILKTIDFLNIELLQDRIEDYIAAKGSPIEFKLLVTAGLVDRYWYDARINGSDYLANDNSKKYTRECFYRLRSYYCTDFCYELFLNWQQFLHFIKLTELHACLHTKFRWGWHDVLYRSICHYYRKQTNSGKWTHEQRVKAREIALNNKTHLSGAYRNILASCCK